MYCLFFFLILTWISNCDQMMKILCYLKSSIKLILTNFLCTFINLYFCIYY